MAGTGSSPISEVFSKISAALGGDTSAVGLSLGTSSIKIVELKRKGKTWKLLHFGIIQLPDDAIVNREIVNHIAVVESIKTIANQLKLKSRGVCTALTGTALMIKRMQIDVPNLRDLQDQVFWEAEQYLPFDVSEVVMDYQLLSRTKDGRSDLIMVAVKRSVLESYMNCIQDAGLKSKIVDVDYFAMQNLFEANYPARPNEAAALVDIGASSVKICVVHNGIPVFTKDTAIGGRNLTAEIQKHMNLSFEDAEVLKVGGGGQERPQEVNELMGIAAENFAGEVKRALDFYDASSSGAPVSAIMLCGGSSKIPELSRIIEEQTGIPTQMLNPFNSIAYDPAVFSPDYLQSIAPIAAIPIGLALRMALR